MTEYVLLMRHGRHEVADQSHPEQRKLSSEGEKETRVVAERLKSWLKELNTHEDFRISIGRFWIAETGEANATATVVKEVLGDLLECPPEPKKRPET